jgi:hypothetical protein
MDESVKAQREEETRIFARRERIAEAGGQVLSAAFNFLGELLPPTAPTPESQRLAADLQQRFAECVETDGDGRTKLTVTFPDAQALQTLTESLSRLLAAGKS